MHHIEIDKDSGFCFGVTTAISKAEEELAKGAPLYCLGDIVHNGQECERLKEMGLITINHEEFARLKNVKVLLRAHGEPPETYELARKNHIEIIDATCPVVLRLQKRIKQEYDTTPPRQRQTDCHLRKKRPCRSVGAGGPDRRQSHRHREAGRGQQTRHEQRHPPIFADNQVARRIRQIVSYIEAHISPEASFQYFDTICRQVATACRISGSSPPVTTWFSSFADIKVPTGKSSFRNVKRSIPTLTR